MLVRKRKEGCGVYIVRRKRANLGCAVESTRVFRDRTVGEEESHYRERNEEILLTVNFLLIGVIWPTGPICQTEVYCGWAVPSGWETNAAEEMGGRHAFRSLPLDQI